MKYMNTIKRMVEVVAMSEAQKQSAIMMLDSKLAGRDGGVGRVMKRFVVSAIAGVLACLLTGCLSVRQLGAFRAAGCPVDNKAVLNLIDESHAPVAEMRVDNEIVHPAPAIVVSPDLVEMLPGRHQIDIKWDISGMELQHGAWNQNERGEFVAENGKEYFLFIDADMQESSFQYSRYSYSISRKYTVRGVSILEFPVGFHGTKSREMKLMWNYTQDNGKTVPNYDLLRKFKTVGILYPTKE